MAIYDYECKKCGTIEIIHPITQDALTECPECGKPIKRVIGKTDFILKGHGWYASDYQDKIGKRTR